MRLSSLIFCTGMASALPSATDSNPFVGKDYFVNPTYAAKLTETISTFLAAGDTLNAARTRTAQGVSTFVWVTAVSSLANIDAAITQARAIQKKTKKPQIIGLVLYNLPGRDCAAGHSSGEFQLDQNGLELYKKTFVDPYAKKVKAAEDLTFAIVLEPDSLGNLVTNMGVSECAVAAPAYVEGIAYAVAQLQAANIALYIDAAHGGWLGWADNLPLAAKTFSQVVQRARKITKSAKIRGFATNVSNFNPYIAKTRAKYTEWSPSFDEKHYVEALTPFLKNVSLPTNFIIDQGRSGSQNHRETWGEWCNVEAGFGFRPTTKTNSVLVDSIVWVKPAGESDGACGPLIGGERAPGAGQWWNEYAAQSIVYANPPFAPTY